MNLHFLVRHGADLHQQPDVQRAGQRVHVEGQTSLRNRPGTPGPISGNKKKLLKEYEIAHLAR